MPLQNTAPPATERTLRASLAFGVDPRGLNSMISGTTDVEDKLKDLDNVLANVESKAKDVEKSVSALATSLNTVGTREAVEASRHLEGLVVQFNQGKIGVEEITQALNEMDDLVTRAVVFQALNEELSQLRKYAADASAEIQDLSNTVQGLESIGQEIAGYARLVTGPLQTFAAQYVQSAGEADEASQRWIKSTEELQAAQTRLGGVAVDAILPILELTSEVVDKAAAFAEEYPELVQAVFGIGTALILANSLQSAVSKGIRLIADAKLVLIEAKRFIAAQMNREAADKMLAAATLNQRAASQQVAGGAGGGIRGAIAGLGGLGGVATSLTVGAAIAAWGAVAIKVKSVADDAQEKTDQMGDNWVAFFDRAGKSSESASQLADEYNDAQRRVNQAYDEGGAVASLLFDREKLVNANRTQLNQALIASARSYEDYEQAVTKLNNELGRDEEQIGLVTEASFNYRKGLAELHDEYIRGEATLRDIARAQLESDDIFQQLGGLVTGITAEIQDAVATSRLVDAWDDLQNDLSAAGERYRTENRAAWDDYFDKREALEEETAERLLQIREQYEAQLLKTELDFETAREDILRSAGDRIVSTEQNIALQRHQAMIDFREEMNQAEEDYYKNRAKQAADFNRDVQRAEQDHQLSMRRMREDSEVRQVQAIRSRDAIALREERRSYETQRQRAEEDYMIQAARRSEDFARQIAQQELAFREQQATRQKAYDEQIKELADRQAKETQIIEEGAEEQLQALDEQRQRDIRSLHDAQEEQTETAEEGQSQRLSDLKEDLKRRRREAKVAQNNELQDAYDTWRDRRQAQGVFLTGELGEIQRHYGARLDALRNWMRAANAVIRSGTSGGPTFGGKASGGYVTAGTYRVGEEGYEYVMDNPTTRMAERLASGNLTQSGLRSIMGGKSFTFSQTVNIADGRDPERTAEVVRRETLTVVHDLLKQVE